MGRSLLGEAEASVQGRPGGPASRTGRAAHGRAAGTRLLSSLRQENKQKAGRLLAGTTGRFPWEVTLQLPSLALRVPAPRAGRPGVRSSCAPFSARGPTEPRDPCGQLTVTASSAPNAYLTADRLHQGSRFRNGGRGCTF